MGCILGWVIVGLYAAALLAVTVTTSDGDLQPGDRERDADAAEASSTHGSASRQATFLRLGHVRTPQRGDRRRHQLRGRAGATAPAAPPPAAGRGRRPRRSADDRVPGATVDGELAACDFGEPAGPTYDEDVATEVAALHTLVEGPSPVYAVERAGDGCFELAQLRDEPRAPFGVEARFCFDDATGAPTNSRVRYAGGIVEVAGRDDPDRRRSATPTSSPRSRVETGVHGGTEATAWSRIPGWSPERCCLEGVATPVPVPC